MKKILFTVCGFMSFTSLMAQNIEKEYRIEDQYMNFPVEMKQEPHMVKFVIDNDTLMWSNIRIAEGEPDYWVFKDVSAFKGKKLKLVFTEEQKGIDRIYLSDRFAGQDSLYKEINRPQFHFTSRRGWNNDPNGLVYYDGEYHLFYQHNPYATDWNNMHWGHAVSKDLLRWEELNDALFPDTLGHMFSGTAVIDKENTAGWGKNAIVAHFTGTSKGQCVAYSTDRGRTFIKYEGNPVVADGDRDPKVFWYEPTQVWVMVLYQDNSNLIYNSKNMKDWEYKSKVKGFFECPELFELAVDNDENNKKWVMYGASGTYMTGTFDGTVFTPEYGKYAYYSGNQYAAQTFNNTPDGRRIQIGWGTITQPGMPFNQMMLFPCELTLRTTPEGVRMFCEPIEEIKELHKKSYSWKNLSREEANEKLKTVDGDLLHLRMDLEIVSGLNMA
ncbi:MAG: glycoside hydrolase family 32 protein, partial [Bacteroidales bacterium]|nr:glycoside hydrolase family 32 protein [Bacteroidales bacterium]